MGDPSAPSRTATLLAGALAAVALAGCGTTTIVRTVIENGAAAPAPTARHRAALSDTLTLTGNGGEKMAVTVQRVADPVQGGPLDQPDPGTRFVGVFIRLANVGQVAYADSPGNGATLLSAAGQQSNDTFLSGGACASGFDDNARIASGESETGCIPFEMPTSQQPAEFQFTLSLGLADDTGEWTLPATATVESQTTSQPSSTPGMTGTRSAPTGPPRGSGTSQCTSNISAGPDTSCPFAENVSKAVAAAYGQTGVVPTQVTAYSPAAGKTYSLNCEVDSAGLVQCSSSTGSVVTFPVSSVVESSKAAGTSTTTSPAAPQSTDTSSTSTTTPVTSSTTTSTSTTPVTTTSSAITSTGPARGGGLGGNGGGGQ
jgi:Domain of unknown function (DUF4352)